MNHNFTHTSLLIQYLDGELSDSGLYQAEQLLASGPEAPQELERLQLAREALVGWGLRQQINAARQEQRGMQNGSSNIAKPAPIRSMRIRTWLVAASIIFALLAVSVYQVLRITPTRLYAQLYLEYDLPVSRGETAPAALESNYRQGNFAAVIQEAESASDLDVQEYFLAGQAYLHTGRMDRAAASFEKILAVDEQQHAHTLMDDAQYYLGLAYIRLGKVNAAIPLFRAINQDPDNLYHDRISQWTLQKLELLRWTK